MEGGRSRTMRRRKEEEDINMLAVAERLQTANRRDEGQMLSNGVAPELFDLKGMKTMTKQYEEELDVLLRARGHPGMKVVDMNTLSEKRKSEKNTRTTLLRQRSFEARGSEIHSVDTLHASASVKTGTQAVQFFATADESEETKVMFLNRCDTGLDFRPYDLVVIPREEIKSEHFTISASGVVHINPGVPAQFTPLSEWWRASSIFSTLRTIPFFKNYLVSKTRLLWFENVRYRKYCQIRRRLVSRLFLAKKAFFSILMEINRQTVDVRNVKFIQVKDKTTYSIDDFAESQTGVRSQATKVFESICDKVQTLLEKVCEDVSSRVRQLELGPKEDEAANSNGKVRSKSMQQEKQEAIARQRALALARQEVGLLTNFIRLADYMMVESLMTLTVESTEDFLGMLQSTHKVGVYSITLSMARGRILYSPELSDIQAMMEIFLDALLNCVQSVPRLLYMSVFKPHFDDKVIGPNLMDMIKTSTVWKQICREIDEVILRDFNDMVTYSEFAKAYFPIFEYAADYDHDSFKNQDHLQNSRSIKLEMLKLRGWGEDLDRMKLQNVSGIFQVDSKTLKHFLVNEKDRVLEDMKSVVLEAAKESCAKVLSDFQQKIKMLSKKPTSLKDFASYVETKNAITNELKVLMTSSQTVDEMYKVLVQFDVKIPSAQMVLLDDLHGINSQFQMHLDGAETEVSGKISQMSSTLKSQINKLDDQLMNIMASLGSGIVLDPEADCKDVLEFLAEQKVVIDDIKLDAETYSHYQKLFGLPQHEYGNLVTASDMFDKKQEVWKTINDWEDNVFDWQSQSWFSLKPDDMDKEIQAMTKLATKLHKRDNDQVSERLKQSVMRWKGFTAVLVALGNPALKERHWRKIFEAMEVPYQQDFTLMDLIQWNVFMIKDTVEEVSGVASGEMALELQLQKIETAWSELKFQVKGYRDTKDVFVLGVASSPPTFSSSSLLLFFSFSPARMPFLPPPSSLLPPPSSLHLFPSSLPFPPLLSLFCLPRPSSASF
eukprot:758288-Hanusia_phi.AAC.1